MADGRNRVWIAVVVVLVLPIVIVLAFWLWVLGSDQPLDNPLSGSLPWPVACTTRGCVTTASWLQSNEAQVLFAQTLEQEAPSAEQTLTTAIRHLLVNQAFLRTPITLEDARRYREDILQNEDESLVTETTGLTLDEYDATVLVPLLQQEALRSQRRVESLDELYMGLASERVVWVFPLGLRWDAGRALVVEE